MRFRFIIEKHFFAVIIVIFGSISFFLFCFKTNLISEEKNPPKTYFSTKSPTFSPCTFPSSSCSSSSLISSSASSSAARSEREVQKVFLETGSLSFKWLILVLINWFCRKWEIGKFLEGFRIKGRMFLNDILSKNTKKIFITYFYLFKRFASSVHLLLQNTLSIYQVPNTGFKQQRLNPKSFVFRIIIKSSLHHACEKKRWDRESIDTDIR